MPFFEAGGLRTRYEVVGSGSPLLMFSPGGFDSSLDSWRTVGIYRRLNLVQHLSADFSCVLFDRRESGQSGGRVERVSWADYVDQARDLIDHLGLDRVHLLGGCVGCSSATALAIAEPTRVQSMVLFSPAGGARYRMTQHERFARHLAFVAEHGLDGVVRLTQEHDQGFSKDPRVGPWAATLRNDGDFATHYAGLNPQRYAVQVAGMCRLLFDRDSVPGPEPEDLLTLDVPALVVPGDDASHAPSAARFFHECLPQSEMWDIPVAEQTEGTAPTRVLEFLRQHDDG